MEAGYKVLETALDRLGAETRSDAEALLARRGEVLDRVAELADLPVHAVKTRIHGDYHLGQVLSVQNDWFIIDFEGEPAKSLEERRTKRSPLVDVAGMVRSYNYAAWAAVFRLDDQAAETAAQSRLLEAARDWERRMVNAFLDSYRTTIAGCPVWPDEESAADRLLALFLLEKGFYEIAYEAANRPGWLCIPTRGVLGLLDGDATR